RTALSFAATILTAGEVEVFAKDGKEGVGRPSVDADSLTIDEKVDCGRHASTSNKEKGTSMRGNAQSVDSARRWHQPQSLGEGFFAEPCDGNPKAFRIRIGSRSRLWCTSEKSSSTSPRALTASLPGPTVPSTGSTAGVRRATTAWARSINRSTRCCGAGRHTTWRSISQKKAWLGRASIQELGIICSRAVRCNRQRQPA